MDLFRTWFWEMDWIWFSYLLTILFNVWVEWWTWFGDRDLLWLLYWCMDVLTLWRLVKRLQMQLLFNWTGNVRVFLAFTCVVSGSVLLWILLIMTFNLITLPTILCVTSYLFDSQINLSDPFAWPVCVSTFQNLSDPCG